MPDQKFNKVILLIGEVIGAVIAWMVDPTHLGSVLWILFGGIVGGFGSMIGREIFARIKNRFKTEKKDVEEN
jgi:hypothetical protein